MATAFFYAVGTGLGGILGPRALRQADRGARFTEMRDGLLIARAGHIAMKSRV